VLISIVVAVAENGVIGRDNALPWRLPDDLRRFKELTLGKPIVMGRRTYESIGRPLPGRTNIVVSRQRDLRIEGCVVVGSMDEAIAAAADASEIMLVGGAQLYREVMPMVDRIYLTRVHAPIDGDVRFPALDPKQWRETNIATHAADERHAYSFSFVNLERVASS
jgi:dihydrofolate reductase